MNFTALLAEFKLRYKIYVDSLTGGVLGGYPLYTPTQADNLILEMLYNAYAQIVKISGERLNLVTSNQETVDFLENLVLQYALGLLLITLSKPQEGIEIINNAKQTLFDMLKNNSTWDNYLFDIDKLI